MTTNVLVAFYSTYGHIHRMALAVAEGAESLPDTTVRLRRIAELEEARKALSAQDAYVRAQQKQADIPVVTHDDLRWAHGIAWGTPTRYGNMSAQMKQFVDTTGGLWLSSRRGPSQGSQGKHRGHAIARETHQITARRAFEKIMFAWTADIAARPDNFRFSSESGHSTYVLVTPQGRLAAPQDRKVNFKTARILRVASQIFSTSVRAPVVSRVCFPRWSAAAAS